MRLDYTAAGAPVRDDLRTVHREILEHVGRPGSFFTGAERVAIARESRAAPACPLCTERKDALSPEHPRGTHEPVTSLAPPLVELAHRIRTDPGRLSRKWFDGLRADGLAEGAYVEAVGIVAFVAGLDAQCRALGIEPFALPEPVAGEASGYLPEGTREGIAWVPILAPEDASGPEADLYSGMGLVPNIVRALSLVPDHVRMLRRSSDVHYVTLDDFDARRALDRMQIELVAARVSALNECFY